MKPVLTPFARLLVKVAAPITIDRTGTRERRFVAILGGEMQGAIDARVLPGGADWQWVSSDGVVEIDAHYALRTAEGAALELRSQGVRRPSGPDGSGSFWSSVTLRGPDSLLPLTQHLFLASGLREDEGVSLTLFRCA